MNESEVKKSVEFLQDLASVVIWNSVHLKSTSRNYERNYENWKKQTLKSF